MFRRLLLFFVLFFCLFFSVSAINVSSCQNISVSGEYFLNQSIFNGTGNCVSIFSDDVLFDCQNFDVNLTNNYVLGKYSVRVENVSNVSVVNCSVNAGVLYLRSRGGLVEGIDALGGYLGVYLSLTNDTVVSDVVVSASSGGVEIFNGSGNMISDVDVSSSLIGFYVRDDAFNNTIYDVDVSSSTYGAVFVDGAYDNLVHSSSLYRNNLLSLGFDSLGVKYPHNNTFYNNSLGNVSQIGSVNWSRTPMFFNSSLSGLNLGNYYSDLNCNEVVRLGSYYKCVSPSSYVMNEDVGIYDYEPLFVFNRTRIYYSSVLYDIDPLNSTTVLNYGETIESETSVLNLEDISFIDDFYFEYDSENFTCNEYLDLKNGEYNRYLGEDIILYNANESFATYIVKLDVPIVEPDTNELRENIFLGKIDLLGVDYMIVNSSFDSENLTFLTLFEDPINVDVGESEEIVLLLDGHRYNFSVELVVPDRVVFTFDNVSVIAKQGDIVFLRGFYFLVADMISSSRSDVLGYAEFEISNRKIDLLDNMQSVLINDVVMKNSNDFSTVVYSKFSGIGIDGIEFYYFVKDEVMLHEGEYVEDELFDKFDIYFEGDNDPDYSEFRIRSNDDEVFFSGYTLLGDPMPSEFVFTTDNIANEVLYLGSTSDRIYHSNSNLLITDLIQAGSLDGIEYNTTLGNRVFFDLNDSFSEVEDDWIWSFVDFDEFYLYEIRSIDHDDLLISFEELFFNVQINERDMDEVQSDLDLNANVVTNTSIGLTFLLDNLGPSFITLENGLLMDFSNVEVVDFNSTTDNVYLGFNYSMYANMDDVSYESDSFNVVLTRAPDFDDAIVLSLENHSFVNFNFTLPGTDYLEYVDHYGTIVLIDGDDKDDVFILVPDEDRGAEISIRWAYEDESMSEVIIVDSLDVDETLGNLISSGYYIYNVENYFDYSLFDFNYSYLGNVSSLFGGMISHPYKDVPFYFRCNQECILDNISVYTYVDNLSEGKSYSELTNYTAIQVSDNAFRINYSLMNFSGYKSVGFNVSNFNSSEFLEFDWFRDYELFVEPLNSSLFENETLVLNVTFNVEPLSDFVGYNVTYYAVYENLSTPDTEAGYLVYNLTSSGVYDVGFIGYNLSNHWKYAGFYDVSVGYASNGINFSVVGIEPQILNYSFVNNSVINVSSLGMYFNMTFDEEISFVEYSVNGAQMDFFYVNDFFYEGDLELLVYGENNVSVVAYDSIGMSVAIDFVVNMSLDLGGNSTDFDNDGIVDGLDSVVGNLSVIFSNVNNLSIEVNGSTNLSRIFDSVYNVSLSEDNKTLVEFSNNFSFNVLNLSNVVLKKDNLSGSRMFVKGLEVESGNGKTLYLDLVGNKTLFGSICLRDDVVNSLVELNGSCAGSSDRYVYSLPYDLDGYEVDYVNSSLNDSIFVRGMLHSGVSQVCTEDWTYSAWSSCSNDVQTRTAIDLNDCGTTHVRFSLSQSCVDDDDDDSSGSDNDDDDDDSSGSSPFYCVNCDGVDDSDNGGVNLSSSRFVLPSSDFLDRYDLSVNLITKLEDVYSGEKTVYVKDKASQSYVLTIDHDFSKSDLNLSSFDIKVPGKQEDINYIIVSGVVGEHVKTINLRAKDKTNTLCVKDAEVSNISEVSLGCDDNDETVLRCDGIKYGSYKCSLSDSVYVISGLRHSAILEIEAVVEDESEVLEGDGSDEEVVSLLGGSSSNKSFYFLVGGVIVVLVVVLVVLSVKSKGNVSEESQVDESVKIDPVAPVVEVPLVKESVPVMSAQEQDYYKAKEYVQMYKSQYSREELFDALIAVGYSRDIVETVIIEEF